MYALQRVKYTLTVSWSQCKIVFLLINYGYNLTRVSDPDEEVKPGARVCVSKLFLTKMHGFI